MEWWGSGRRTLSPECFWTDAPGHSAVQPPMRSMRSAGSVRGVRFGGLLLRSQAAAEDGRTNTIPANHFVIVTSGVNPDAFAGDDPDDRVPAPPAAPGPEPAPHSPE